MTTWRAPSAPDLLFIVTAPMQVARGAVKLTQSDGDLAAHLRMGETILRLRHIPAHSLASYTAATESMISPGWLSEVLFALFFRVGGLPLLVVVTAIIIGLTHALVAVFLRDRGVDPRWALAAALISLPLASTHWLTRPHMFSIVGAVVTLFLVESESKARNLFFFAVFAVWANLHGGWLYGLLMIGAYIVGDLLEAWIAAEKAPWLARARSDGIALAVASCATVVNPYGLRVHVEVFSAVTSQLLARNIDEYMPPNFQEFGQLPFLVVLMLILGLMALARERMPLRWLVLIGMSLFFALRSARNIALFAVSAWPLVALHASRAWPRNRREFPFFKEFARIDLSTRLGLWAAPVAMILLGLGLNRGNVGGYSLLPDHFDRETFPVAAVEAAKRSAMTGRVFEPWVWAGYLMYAWPAAQLHVDPLKFSERTIDSYRKIAGVSPTWRAELDRWDVATLFLHPQSQLARMLAADSSWQLWYRDSTAAVFRRRQPLFLKR